MKYNRIELEKELGFKAIRSSGAGGQNVNKVATKIELHFDLEKSQVFEEEQKVLLKNNLENRLTKDRRLVLQCGETRSQVKNKNLVIERFFNLIDDALVEEKERKITKMPKAVKLKRLKSKKKRSEIKANRKPPEIE